MPMLFCDCGAHFEIPAGLTTDCPQCGATNESAGLSIKHTRSEWFNDGHITITIAITTGHKDITISLGDKTNTVTLNITEEECDRFMTMIEGLRAIY